MVLSSAVLSTVAAGIQLYYSYQRDSSEVLQTFGVVDQSFRDSLERAVWQFNFPQVESILEGIVANPNVSGVSLVSSTGQTWQRGQSPGDMDEFSRPFQLTYRGSSGPQQIVGELRVSLTLDDVRDRLWAQFWTMFLSNVAKTLVASLVMMLLFYLLVARHLRTTARYVARTDWIRSGRALALDRRSANEPDDLDNVVTAINHARGKVLQSVSGLEREIDVRRQAEQEATRASEAKSAFLATMSHEVRTPINAIMGLLELIERADIPARQRRQAKAGRSSAEALLYQLTNVLEVSRLEAHAINLLIEPVNMNEFVEELRALLEGVIARSEKPIAGAVLSRLKSTEDMNLDRRRLLEIVSNLIDNAVRFTEQGRIDVNLDIMGPVDDAIIMVQVQDTGIGIAEDHLERIFDRFAQVENPLTRKMGGSGLGLAISRGLAQLMGGDLRVESCVGQGSRFTLTIPATRETIEEKSRESSSS